MQRDIATYRGVKFVSKYKKNMFTTNLESKIITTIL